MKTLKPLMTIAATLVCVCGYSQVSYKINATGQTLCYDDEGNVIETPKVGDKFYGQDANYIGDAELVFVDNGDGTVSDPNTGLMWQQAPPAEGMTWYEAKEYCENLEFGGYSDWRLPTLKELFSISNFEQGWPYLDTVYLKLSNGIVTKDEQYWGDSKYVGETVEGRDDAAFGVNHVTGHIKAYPAGSNMGGREGRGEGQGQQSRPDMGEGQTQGQGRPPMMGNRGEGMDSLQQGGRPPMMGNRGEGMDSLQQGGRPPMMGNRGEGMDSLQQGGRPPMMGNRGEGMDSLQQGGRPPMMAGRGQGEQGQGGQGQARGGMPQGGQGPMMQGGQGGMPMGNPMAKQVRAVRGEIYGKNNFVDNSDGTISDLATGLMWAKDDNGEGVEWTDALIYAEGAELAGYSDWRLPNVKELQSIVDYSRAPSSKGVEAAIDPIFNCTPFVNEAGDDDYGYCWTGTSACFTRGRPFYFAWYVAFGRAVNNEGADFHGAGAVRFDSKSDNGMVVEGGEERYYNFVRLVRNIPAK